MTSVAVGFIMQYQFVTSLRAERVRGRVIIHPSLLRSFRENPSVTLVPVCIHHSPTCRVPTFSLPEAGKARE